MFENLIFDFGQVIVRFDPLYMTSKYITEKEDIKIVANVVFDRLYWDRLDAGTITDEEVIVSIKERLPDKLKEDAVKVYNNWIHNIPLIDGMYELLSELKEQGRGLYLLSNISIGFAQNYHKNPDVKKVLDLFDGLCFSGPLGIVKPTRQIFDHILGKYSLSIEDTVFIDDSKININGAKEVGIKGYLFDGDVEKLRAYLIG